MFKRLGFYLISFFVMLGLCCCSGEKEKSTQSSIAINLKLATVTPMSHTYSQGGNKFAELVREKSKGRIQITIYPDGQLGKGERELLESIQQGTVDIYVGSTGPISGFSPSVAILDIPFLFHDYAHVDKVLDGPIGKELLNDMEKSQFKALAFWENGFRNLTNSKREVKNPADVKGLKIRTMENKVHVAAWKAVGANPVPMAFGDLYGELKQQVVDGQENPVAVIYAVKFNEVQKYMSLTQHVYSPGIIICSLKKWQSLPREDQELLLATAREVAVYQRKLGRDEETRQIAELSSKGMIVTKNIDKAPWRKAMQPAVEETVKQFGKEKVDAILNTK